MPLQVAHWPLAADTEWYRDCPGGNVFSIVRSAFGPGVTVNAGAKVFMSSPARAEAGQRTAPRSFGRLGQQIIIWERDFIINGQ